MTYPMLSRYKISENKKLDILHSSSIGELVISDGLGTSYGVTLKVEELRTLHDSLADYFSKKKIKLV